MCLLCAVRKATVWIYINGIQCRPLSSNLEIRLSRRDLLVPARVAENDHFPFVYPIRIKSLEETPCCSYGSKIWTKHEPIGVHKNTYS